MTGRINRRSSDAKIASSQQPSDIYAAEAVIAATAGRNTWQTWAGRSHGTEDFEVLDVFRGIKRSINHSLGTKLPKPGTPCPICFCEPSDTASWHVTWCGHAVCKDCLGHYAASQVGDRERHGPLQCPICLKVLRKEDAVVAMLAGKRHASNQEDLIQKWDVKMRDQLLRAIPSFRSCPHCSGGTHDRDDEGNSVSKQGIVPNTAGGGFVTPECLGPHHQERRDQAIQILLMRNYAYAAIVGIYLGLIGIIAQTQSPSPQLDLWSMLLPIWVFFKVAMTVNFLLAQKAREALFRSIVVQCPCCEKTFVLPAESKQIADEETSRWVNANTRPCPSCSVPISKTGGCNHMRCSHCGVGFCWACMRLRTTCRAYKCQNGAPFRNASLFDVDDEQLGGDGGRRRVALQRDGSVLTYIDYILNHRVSPELNFSDGALIVACLIARHWTVVQYLQDKILSPFIFYLMQKIDIIVMLAFVLSLTILALPFDWLHALTQQLVAQGLILPELADQIIDNEPRVRRQQQQFLCCSVLSIVLCTSIFSLPTILSLIFGFLVIQVISLLQQPQQNLAGHPNGRQEQEFQDWHMPHDANQIDELNQNMLNEALRRSIEDT